MFLTLNYKLLISLFIPFFSILLGSLSVFFFKNKLNNILQKLLLGLSSGIMLALAVCVLLVPSINYFNVNSTKRYLSLSIFFILGLIIIILIDLFIPHIHTNNKEEGIKANTLDFKAKYFISSIIHNVSEGLAVGFVITYGFIEENISNTALLLAIGIGCQNLFESMIQTFKIKEYGYTKAKAFIFGIVSGLIEPLVMALCIPLGIYLTNIIPYVLSFVCGIMIYIAADEIIPDKKDKNKMNFEMLGLNIGFIFMFIISIMVVFK